MEARCRAGDRERGGRHNLVLVAKAKRRYPLRAERISVDVQSQINADSWMRHLRFVALQWGKGSCSGEREVGEILKRSRTASKNRDFAKLWLLKSHPL